MTAELEGGEGSSAPSPEMKALVDLIKALVSVNKRVMTLTNILGIQKKLMRHYPQIILKLKVDRNFGLECKMEGSAKDLEALAKFLEEYLRALMDMVPPKNLSDRIFTTVKSLGQEAALELLASGAADLLPVELVEQIRIAADFGDRLNNLRNNDARTQAIVVYEELFSRLLGNVMMALRPKEGNFKAFCTRIEGAIRTRFIFIDEFMIEENYRVSIKAKGGDLETFLDAMAHIYDALVYGSAKVLDEAEVKSLGRRTALTVLGEFEDIPDSCGVTASLLRGALSAKVRTGTLGMDRLLDGGLDRKSNTLLVAPNIIERDFLLASFIKTGFQNGEEVLAIISKMDPERILDMLTQDDEYPDQLGKFKLHIYTPMKEEEAPDTSGPDPEQTNGNGTNGTPSNLIELNRFLIKVVKEYGPGQKRALIEVLDESKRVFGEERLYWYLTRYMNILKEYGFSTIFLVDIKVIGKELLTNVLDLFDNTIEIRKRAASYAYEIGRVAAKKLILDPEFRLLTINDKGITISED